MYDGANDKCRLMFLSFAFDHHMPLGFWLPPLVGEILNGFVAICLCFCLFLNYCTVEETTSLILNAIAFNFLGTIDSELVSPKRRNAARANFNRLFPEYADKSGRTFRSRIALITLKMIITLGTLGLGHGFAAVFLLYNQPYLCPKISILSCMGFCPDF